MKIDGEWHNEHGSRVDLRQDGRNLRGTYHTPVGVASGVYEVVGTIDDSDGPCLSVAFVVQWKNASGNSHSVTAWAGQLVMVEGDEVIQTTWLLTTEGSADDWHSTQIGHDMFRRNESREQASRRSHPRPYPKLHAV